MTHLLQRGSGKQSSALAVHSLGLPSLQPAPPLPCSTAHHWCVSAATHRTGLSQPSRPAGSTSCWGLQRRAVPLCTGDCRWVGQGGGAGVQQHSFVCCVHLLQDFLPASGPPLYTNHHCLSAMGGNIMSLQVCVYSPCGVCGMQQCPSPTPPPPQLRGESTLFSSTSKGHVLIHNLAVSVTVCRQPFAHSTACAVNVYVCVCPLVPCYCVVCEGVPLPSTCRRAVWCTVSKPARVPSPVCMSLTEATSSSPP